MRISLVILFIAGLLISFRTTGQGRKDSVFSYPVYKPLIVEYGVFATSGARTKLKDGTDYNAQLSFVSRLHALANVWLIHKGKFNFSTTVNYVREEYKEPSSAGNKSLTMHDMDLVFSALYIDSLFGRPIVYSGNLILGSSRFYDLRKVSAIGTASFIFQRSPYTRQTLGLSLLMDPSSPIPVFPSYTYWHKFKNSAWQVNLVLPQSLYFRKSYVWNGWLSIGTELTGNNFFTRKNVSTTLNDEFRYSALDNNIGYEKILAKHWMAGIKAGYRTYLDARVLEVYARPTEYIARTYFKDCFFANVSLAFVFANKELAEELRSKRGTRIK